MLANAATFVHALEPSGERGQEYDIFIYLIRHKSENYGDLESAEFFLGHYWGNRIFVGEWIGRFVGVQTSAYGPFLCTCRLTFKDGESVTLSRYIDFEMAPVTRGPQPPGQRSQLDD